MNINANFPINSLYKRVNDLEINCGKITMGQGEYVVFRQSPTEKKEDLPREIYEQAYKVLIKYSPIALMKSRIPDAANKCLNRYELIKQEIKKIDSSLEIAFIPQTLYELFLIRKTIKEDLKHDSICPELDSLKTPLPARVSAKLRQEIEEERCKIRAERKCWHLCHFTDYGNNEDPGIKEVAFRLNKSIVKAFNPESGGFTQKEFSSLLETQMKFFKKYYADCQDLHERRCKGEKVKILESSNLPSTTTCFGSESSRGKIKPMGIRNEEDAQILKDALTLECSKLAITSCFFYRGSNLSKDSVLCSDNPDRAYSLSYGSGVFAGCIYDGGACAWHYMRDSENDAHAGSVPYEEINDHLLISPYKGPLAPIYGDGEIFHGRTGGWNGFDITTIGGMKGEANGHITKHLETHLSKDKFLAQFENFKNNVILLGGPKTKGHSS
jgi:hypothetical protein